MSQDQNVVSTRKAAKMLGVSLRTVQLWVEAGVLQAWKTAGNHRRVYVSSIEQLLRQRSGGVPHVLVVEDDPVVQAYYQALFEQVQPPVDVRYAEDGFVGLMLFGTREPDLMIVDIDMPYMDGLQMLAAMDKMAASVDKVIVTSLSEAEIAQRGEIPAGVPVHAKPLSKLSFQSILNTLPGRPALVDEQTAEA